jgi:diguanylate cyclase (GGDEF)-like protein
MTSILYIEDNPDDVQYLKQIIFTWNRATHLNLNRGESVPNPDPEYAIGSFHLVHAKTLAEGITVLEQEKTDVVLLDLSLPDADGLETLKMVIEQYSDIPIVVLSGHDDETLALEALQLGAQDYLVKEHSNGHLIIRAVRYAIERRKTLLKLETVHQQEHHLAYHDQLTALPNRQLFFSRLQHAVAQARRHTHFVAVFFLDLDGFKRINDTLGHRVGDQLLQEVAQRLKTNLRESDTIARIGGDEFTIILNEVTQIKAVTLVANKILHLLQEPIEIGDNELSISTSIGISLYPNDGTDVESLVKHADFAMYQAKSQGKNCFQFFNSAMSATEREYRTLENQLRQAIKNNELILHYQPQVEIQSGRITGIEALVRWQHPEFGLLLPQKFIPMAEETGFIKKIGEWVLQTACSQSKLWLDKGFSSLRLSVNISAKQFQEKRLANTIRRILKETDFPAECLTIEITESNAMKDVNHTHRMFQLLKDVGVQLFVDDFGKGNFSLNCLKRFPIAKLKIDRSLMSKMIRNPDDAAITSAIIALAHQLNLKVIAKGVETIHQFNFLRDLQCDEIQGFHFSKPLPAAELAQILKQGAIKLSSAPPIQIIRPSVNL